MPILNALYYPHTDIVSPVILKNALLLWDTVETIVPHPTWRPNRDRWNKATREAAELIISHRVPNESERREAHKQLRSLLQSGLLFAMVQQSPSVWQGHHRLIHHEKFLWETWRALSDANLAHADLSDADYGVPPAVALLMMSVLAAACSGRSVQRVTDKIEAYSWLSQVTGRLLGTQLVSGLDASQVAPDHDRLVTISLEVLDGRAVSMRSLVAMRRREHRGRSEYADFRHRYITSLQEHVARVATEARSPADVRELNRQFKQELRHDLKELRRELRLAGTKALFSKEVAVSALILAGAMTAPVAGLTTLGTEIGGLGIIPLVKTAAEYRGSRSAALAKHRASWLYLVSRGRVTRAEP